MTTAVLQRRAAVFFFSKVSLVPLSGNKIPIKRHFLCRLMAQKVPTNETVRNLLYYFNEANASLIRFMASTMFSSEVA